MKKKLSDKDWLEKFYPVEPSPEMTWEQAVDHTLLKWSGAKKEVLQEYGCENINGTIVNRHNAKFYFLENFLVRYVLSQIMRIAFYAHCFMCEMNFLVLNATNMKKNLHIIIS